MLLITITLAFNISAQDEEKKTEEIRTLFGSHISTNGGYGAFSPRYTFIDGLSAFGNGGRGGWIINHRFVIGGGGYGYNSISRTDNYTDTDKKEYKFNLGYGGFMIETIISPLSPIHVSIPILIGGGDISYIEATNNNKDASGEHDNFFVIEPGIEIEANLIRWMRISAGTYYRYTSDINLKYPDDKKIADKGALRGVTFGLAFKFGLF